jgi:hypothetical protein
MEKLRLFYYPVADCRLAAGHDYRPVPVLQDPSPEFWERVSQPADADFLVFPVVLTDVGVSLQEDPDYLYHSLPTLPYFAQHEARHVFFLLGVDTWAPLFFKSVFFRTSVHQKFPDLNAVAYPHYCADPGYDTPYAEVVHNTSFVGFVGSWPGRVELAKALHQAQGLSACCQVSTRWHDHLPPEQRAENASRYQAVLRRSLTVCCPRGAGLNSIRFFETLAAGRIPILISDDCRLPLEDVIDYDRFILRLPEAEISRIGPWLGGWFHRTPPEAIAERCVAARTAWEEFLSPAQGEQFVLHALHKIRARAYQLNAARADALAQLARALKAQGKPAD